MNVNSATVVQFSAFALRYVTFVNTVSRAVALMFYFVREYLQYIENMT